MEGQLSLFLEEQKPNNITEPKKQKERKPADPSQSFDERMKRFLHYIEMKGMNEQSIETCAGELRIIIDALADYYDVASKWMEEMEGYARAAWEHRLGRIKQIQGKLEESIGYNRDNQLEACKKKKVKNDDIGEDALVLMAKRSYSVGSADKKGKDGNES